MNRQLLRFLTAAAGSVLLAVGCTGNQVAVSDTSPEGNCVGMVLGKDGAPISGASVLLVPEGYSPLSSENGGSVIDSTVSDHNGRFGFTVSGSGKFNLLARGNDLYAIRQSIGISASARLELAGDTLLEPGSLSGTIQLQGRNDHRMAVILFIGTNFYAQPSDSTGRFAVPALAQGTYRLRCLGMESGFAAVETTVTAVSGAAVSLPAIVIASKREPKVDSFRVAYDPLMMTATLSWTTNDRDIIGSFRIYCNRELNIRPVYVAGDSTASCEFDLVALPTGTFAYQITAVGKDGWEGPASIAAPFVNKSAIRADTLTRPPSNYYSEGPAEEGFYLTGNGCYFISSSHWNPDVQILKCDNDFTVKKKINFTVGMAHIIANSLTILGTDENGNFYTLTDSLVDSTSVTLLNKFDPDFNLVDRHQLPNRWWANITSMMVAADGSVIFYKSHGYPGWERKNTDSTIVEIFDPQFNLTAKTAYTDSREIMESEIRNDTITAVIRSNAWPEKRIYYFDKSFRIIGIDSMLITDAITIPDDGFARTNPVHIVAGNLFVYGVSSYNNDLPSILYFFNQRDEMVARYPVTNSSIDYYDISDRGLFSDHKGNIYFLDREVIRYSVGAVIDALKQ